MLLNRIESALVNNAIRAAIQRYAVAPRLVRMGGVMGGGRALEIGCGRGIGTEIIFGVFGADTVEAFDLDPRMIVEARTRLAPYRPESCVWVGDATRISAANATYDAVFDFGIIHHIPEWRRALAEICRVLKPGGRFYAEEFLERAVVHPISRLLLKHPQTDRFDSKGFVRELDASGLEVTAMKDFWGYFAWFTAVKRTSD